MVALIRIDSLAFNLITVSCLLAIFKRAGIPRAREGIFFLLLKLSVIALSIRMFFAMVIGVPMPGQTLFELPSIQLPEFLVGVRLGGAVTLDRITSALAEATMFAALLIAFGLANAISTPTRLIKVLPARLYGLGTAATLATTLIPNVTRSIQRVRRAQFLRGQSENGLRSWSRVSTPVLEDSLAKSIDLAAALEARGYGLNPNPSRYKAESWGISETISLLAVIYLALFFPLLELSPIFEYGIFLLLILFPAELK